MFGRLKNLFVESVIKREFCDLGSGEWLWNQNWEALLNASGKQGSDEAYDEDLHVLLYMVVKFKLVIGPQALLSV
jgi:hypothetical protein